MKQINNMLDRYFEGKSQLKTKWHCHNDKLNNVEVLKVYHYQHLITVIRLSDNKIIHEYYECPTDLRGLNSIKEYFNNKPINDDNKNLE